MESIVGRSNVMQEALDLSETAAVTSASICLLGESGTGKELFAKLIHQKSYRARQAFITVNCGALPSSMIESLLFGHERGAFTGATDRHIGFIEQAHLGTLFLDEIAELPFELQTRLLRVLEEGCIQRLGARSKTAVNFRLITATHQDLPQLVQQGRFRADLLYRLYVIPIFLPPLRTRNNDILLLAEYFLKLFSPQQKIATSADAKNALLRYSWPGNVRELKNTLQRAVLLCRNNIIQEEDLHFLHFGLAHNLPSKKNDRENLQAILHKYRGNRSHAANELGIARSTLLARMKRLGIKKENFSGKK